MFTSTTMSTCFRHSFSSDSIYCFSNFATNLSTLENRLVTLDFRVEDYGLYLCGRKINYIMHFVDIFWPISSKYQRFLFIYLFWLCGVIQSWRDVVYWSIVVRFSLKMTFNLKTTNIITNINVMYSYHL